MMFNDVHFLMFGMELMPWVHLVLLAARYSLLSKPKVENKKRCKSAINVYFVYITLHYAIMQGISNYIGSPLLILSKGLLHHWNG